MWKSRHVLSFGDVHWLRSFFLLLLVLTPTASYALWTQSVAAQQVISQSVGQPGEQAVRILSVTGQGRQFISTTLTQVNLGVVVEAPTAEDAQQQVAERQTAVIEWLRSQSVEKLETTGISLNPRYDYRNDRQTLRGYEASNALSFRVETERAGAIIDEAVSVGATRINNVSFVAEDEAIEAAQQQALVAAVQDAQMQADTVLAALGLSRQEVISIVIGSASAPPPSPVSQRLQVADAEASTPVLGQSQEVNAQVTLHIRY